MERNVAERAAHRYGGDCRRPTRRKRSEIHWQRLSWRCIGVAVAFVAIPLPRRRISDRGFVLVASLVLMILLVTLALGMLSLATVELRRSTSEEARVGARANARLALAQAIGQLQKTLGPDQRVSATAEILGGNPEQPHWTGVWRSTKEDGSSFFTRNDLAGGLSDARWPARSTPADRVMEWLVSGVGNPIAGPGGDSALMLRDGDARVEVPKVAVVQGDGSVAGASGVVDRRPRRARQYRQSAIRRKTSRSVGGIPAAMDGIASWPRRRWTPLSWRCACVSERMKRPVSSVERAFRSPPPAVRGAGGTRLTTPWIPWAFSPMWPTAG